ncbi:MAG: hypothetical protein UW63_C0022G0002 [Candidatus Uhrbacteria bacterium GW2011_GWF2_44_350]|uniref:Caib/baif family protein n=1 Tax=Candidatus Uhrbacteria bacterium GW2011_GWF2_44_350 TaxID=1619000 RepID=A0A0G1JGH6_9BACT|nr:MAG: hypothetical protein UW63_C0022G0002 [Candidatus Uhrbacteria bacterium GW2011_GWF2_44_350]HBR80904.1 hypothetical protein [Candidatus Uhrbacteria bacterium]
MSKTPNYDSKLQPILAALTPGERLCALTGEKWLMTDEEIGWYKKFNVPPSKYSPLNRMRIMSGYFIMYNIFYNKHADTGRQMMSTIPPASGFRVLEDKEWYERDFSEKGISLDAKKSFFDQLYELSLCVPLPAHDNIVPPENSLAFLSFGDIDSYLVMASRSKRSLVCSNAFDTEDSAEIIMGTNVRESYKTMNSSNLFRCQFVQDSWDCQNCYFLFDCRNCEHCFGVANQRHKKYLWFNEQLSKEEYECRLAEVDLSSFKVREEYEKRFADFVQTQAVWPENSNINTQNSTGEYLEDTTNARECYNVRGGSRDIDHVTWCLGTPSENCAYCGGATGSTDCYYSVGVTNCHRAFFNMNIVTDSRDLEYCTRCFSCENCFGCVGLRHKKFCVLNKQYTEEEYWKILDDLKCRLLEEGNYGDIPGLRFSTQHWSSLLDLFEIDKATALKLGGRDFDLVSQGADGPEVSLETILPLETIPDRLSLDDYENLPGKFYFDPSVGRRFSYMKPELMMYQKLKVAPPRQHPRARIMETYKRSNKPEFFDTVCKSCNKAIRVAKNPAYPDRKIFCRACYNTFIEKNN